MEMHIAFSAYRTVNNFDCTLQARGSTVYT